MSDKHERAARLAAERERRAQANAEADADPGELSPLAKGICRHIGESIGRGLRVMLDAMAPEKL